MTARANFFKISGPILCVFLCVACNSSRYSIEYNSIYTGTLGEGVHSRALYASDKFVVIGGMDGHVAVRFIDPNRSRSNQMQIEGISDFRDVHCNSDGECIFLNSGTNAILTEMTRKGMPEVRYQKDSVFLDGMSFWGEREGIAYGDPVGDSFFLIKTTDKGQTWQELNPKSMPKTIENEAGFAASGSGIQTIGDSTVYFATGLGEVARLFCSYDRGENWTVKNTPLKSGNGSYGIYSMYFWSENEGVVIGGSYKDSTYSGNICQYTADGGDSWKNRSKGLAGYCSCIAGSVNGDLLVATGRMGTFYSLNKGKTWNSLTKSAYYTCTITETHIVLVGKNGSLEFIEYTLTENQA